MSLRSQLIDIAKSVDAWIGRPAARWSSGPRRPLPEAPRRVLVLRLWGLGNLTLLAPQLAANADRELWLLTLEANRPFVLRHLPGVTPITVPDPHHPRWLPAVLAAATRLARDPPELVLDAEAFLRLPALLARTCSGAPVVGLDTPGQGRRPLLDAAVPYDPTRHVADSYRALFERAGLASDPRPGGLHSAAADQGALAAELALDERPVVVLHPGSGDHFPGRRWAPERFGELARRLDRDGHQVLLTGTPAERAVLEAVGRHAGGAARDLSGRLDAGALVDLLALADLVVTNDTGPLHMADALGTACVALYGPNTPHRYGPRQPGARALFADLPCSPCLDDRSMKRSSCRHFACMDALDTASVLAACRAALTSIPGEPRPHAVPA